MGRTLRQLRLKAGFETRGRVVERVGDLNLSEEAIRRAEANPVPATRASNLHKLLAAFGEKADGYLRRVGVAWDGSFESELRLEVVEAMEGMDRAALHQLAELARKLKPAAVAGKIGDGQEPPHKSVHRRYDQAAKRREPGAK